MLHSLGGTGWRQNLNYEDQKEPQLGLAGAEGIAPGILLHPHRVASVRGTPTVDASRRARLSGSGVGICVKGQEQQGQL